MTHRFGILRRFRFNAPQRTAAVMLALFLLQGFWLINHQTLTDRDYQYARCGRESTGAPLSPRRLLHLLRQHPRRHSRLPSRRPPTHTQPPRRPRHRSFPQTGRPRRASPGWRNQHVGIAPSNDAHAPLAPSPISLCRLSSRRLRLVGHPSPLRQPWRIHRTRSLLFLAFGHQGLRLPPILRSSLHSESTAASTPASVSPTPCKARVENGDRASSCSAPLRSRCHRAHCRIAHRRNPRMRAHALGC